MIKWLGEDAKVQPEEVFSALHNFALTLEKGHRYNLEVEEKEAVEGMFGGSEYQRPPWKTSSAYMLVYVLESAIPELSVEVTEDDLAAHMRNVKV